MELLIPGSIQLDVEPMPGAQSGQFAEFRLSGIAKEQLCDWRHARRRRSHRSTSRDGRSHRLLVRRGSITAQLRNTYARCQDISARSLRNA